MAEVTKFVGANAQLRDLRKLIKFAPDEFGRALLQETKIEVKECKAVCPVDTGTMRDEIHEEGPFREGRRIWTTISTGPESAEYALRQHEDLELFHKKGEAKFIERPLKESAPHMGDRIAKRIDLNKAL